MGDLASSGMAAMADDARSTWSVGADNSLLRQHSVFGFPIFAGWPC
jgi:hypothetical protein